MINGKRVIALIPARGGSKSIPRKNLQLLGNTPLVAWAIQAAKEAMEIDRVIVSTDNEEIAQCAEKFGAEVYRRPVDLSGDHSLVVDTVRHLTKVLDSEAETAEIFVLLEPTSPVRQKGLISDCLNQLVSTNSDSVATFQELSIRPQRIWRISSGIAEPFIEGSIPWKPRQELEVGYELNGAVYAFFPRRLPEGNLGLLFGRTSAIVSQERVIDIDTETDLRLVNDIYNKHK